VATFLKKAIELVDLQIQWQQNVVNCPLKQQTVKLEWTSTIVDYVEWVYGLHELLNQNASLQTLFDVFNRVFDIEVHNYRQYFRSIKNRKKTERLTIFERQHQLFTQRKEKGEQ